MHMPAPLVMQLMGIRSIETYQRYQQVHPQGLIEALEDRRPLEAIEL